MKRIPVYVKKGRNFGKRCGEIIYPDKGIPYYFCVKTPTQMMAKPEYKRLLLLSSSVIKEELMPREIKIGIWELSGFEDKTFFIVIPIKDFLNGKRFTWDDIQYATQWDGNGRKRHYEFPRLTSLMDYM